MINRWFFQLIENKSWLLYLLDYVLLSPFIFADMLDFKIEVRKENHFFFIRIFRELFWHHNMRVVPFNFELNRISVRSKFLSDFFSFGCAGKWSPVKSVPHDHLVIRLFYATIKKTCLFRIQVNLQRVICFFIVFIQLIPYPGNHFNEIWIWTLSHYSMNIWIGSTGEEEKKTFQDHILFGFEILLPHLIESRSITLLNHRIQNGKNLSGAFIVFIQSHVQR